MYDFFFCLVSFLFLFFNGLAPEIGKPSSVGFVFPLTRDSWYHGEHAKMNGVKHHLR